MKLLFNIAILIAFSIGYSEWGKDQSAFIGSMEYEILFNPSIRNSQTMSHPIVLAGIVGQIALLLASFPIKYSKLIHLLSCLLLGIVPFILLVAGLFSANFKMTLSVIPFFGLVILYYRIFYRSK